MKRALLAAAAALLLGPGSAGGDAAVRAEGAGAHALIGARLVPRPGAVVPSGTLVVRDGLIEAVGAGVEAPADARLWERRGLTVYAGWIEPYAVRSWEGEEPQAASSSLVHPERDLSLRPPDDELARRLRAAGFTTAVMAPAEGIFRGWGVLLNLGAGDLDRNLLRRRTAQFVSLRWNDFDSGYPTSRMGATAVVRQTLLDSRWHRQARRDFEARPAQARPRFVPAWAELESVAHGEIPIVFETRGAPDGPRFARLAAELGIDAVLVGSGDEYAWLDQAAGSRLPYILPLDFPPRPEIGDEDDLSIGLAELRRWDLAPENPRRLLDSGARVAFTSHGFDEPRRIHEALAEAVGRGLSSDQALAALTTTPAELLGIADRAGTLEPGKMANLIVVEGDLFGEEFRLIEVWIDGVRYPLDPAQPDRAEDAGDPPPRENDGARP